MSARDAKPSWDDVPAAVRREVTRALDGGEVVEARQAHGGYAPSATFRLTLAGGARAFMKGAGPASSPYVRRALAREVSVYRSAAAVLAPDAPALLGAFETAGWRVLLLEDLGSHRRADVARTLAVVAPGLARFHARNIGARLPGLLRSRIASVRDAWSEIAASPSVREAVVRLAGPDARDEAAARRWLMMALPVLRAAAGHVGAPGARRTLLHMDLRLDNLCVQADGRLRLFDWSFAMAGPPELDVAGFAQSVAAEAGVQADGFVAAYRRHLLLDERILDASVAGLAGYFASVAWRPAPPSAPRLAISRRRQLAASLAWSARRLGLDEPAWLDRLTV